MSNLNELLAAEEKKLKDSVKLALKEALKTGLHIDMWENIALGPRSELVVNIIFDDEVIAEGVFDLTNISYPPGCTNDYS
jgi:hypothetical protein